MLVAVSVILAQLARWTPATTSGTLAAGARHVRVAVRSIGVKTAIATIVAAELGIAIEVALAVATIRFRAQYWIAKRFWLVKGCKRFKAHSIGRGSIGWAFSRTRTFVKEVRCVSAACAILVAAAVARAARSVALAAFGLWKIDEVPSIT